MAVSYLPMIDRRRKMEKQRENVAISSTFQNVKVSISVIRPIRAVVRQTSDRRPRRMTTNSNTTPEEVVGTRMNALRPFSENSLPWRKHPGAILLFSRQCIELSEA